MPKKSDPNPENRIFFGHVNFYTFLAVLGGAELTFLDPKVLVFGPSIRTVGTFFTSFRKKSPVAQLQSRRKQVPTFFVQTLLPWCWEARKSRHVFVGVLESPLRTSVKVAFFGMRFFASKKKSIELA